MRKTLVSLLILELIIAFFLLIANGTIKLPKVISTTVKPEMRIVSLTPATTEILFALGLEKEIIGVTTYCDYPQKATEKFKVGSFSQPSIEKILTLKPDLVLTTDHEQNHIVFQLDKLNIRTYVHSPKTLEEMLLTIEDIGQLTNRYTEALALTKRLKVRINKISAAVYQIPIKLTPSVYIEISANPIFTAGPGSFIDELITLAGGRNIADDIPRPYSYYSSEQVINNNPDCIIMTYMNKDSGLDLIKRRVGWSKLSAVTNKMIFNDISPDWLLRPGPRLVDGLEAVFGRLGLVNHEL